MKIRDKLINITRILNKQIVSIFLVITYVLVCIYNLFYKKKHLRWVENPKNIDEIEQSKHLW